MHFKPSNIHSRYAFRIGVWLWAVWGGLGWWMPNLWGGNYLVSTFGADEGLPQTSVMDVAQTPDGYLWVGTLMGGVARFDGLRFVNFELEGIQGQGPPQVNRLFTDSLGRLWVNTFFGLLRYEAGEFISELHPQFSQELRLTGLPCSSSNLVIFTATQPKLLRGTLDGKGKWSWDFLQLTNAESGRSCRVDENGTAWYIRSDNRVGRLKNGIFDSLGPEAGLPAGRLTVLAPDRNGNPWIGSDHGLAFWVTNRFVSRVPTNGPAQMEVRSVFFGNGDSAWVLADSKVRRMVDGEWVAEAQGLEKSP